MEIFREGGMPCLSLLENVPTPRSRSSHPQNLALLRERCVALAVTSSDRYINEESK